MATTIPNAERRRSALYEDFAECAADQLIRVHLMKEEAAIELAEALAQFLVDHWGGQNIYIPREFRHKTSERDWEIFRRLERGNANELAAEFGISQVRVYQINRRCAEMRRAQLIHSSAV